MTASAVSIRYAGLGIELHCDPAIRAAIAAELEPFFAVGPNDGTGSLLRLELAGAPPDALRRLTGTPGTPVAVDTSLYKHLASTGTRWEMQGGHAVRIDATGTLVTFDREDRLVRLHQEDAEIRLRDAVRAIKNLFTPAVERAGAVQIHCSGVVSGGRAILLLGDMWQGKTTVLLEMLDQFDVGMLSCDTTVIRPEADRGNGVSVAGWPSPFSVSHGTLSDHGRLHDFFPQERRGVPYAELWREGRKSVLKTEQVVERFGSRIVPQADEVAACIVLRFKPDEPTRLEPVGSAEDLAAHLHTVYLGSRDPIYHNWHGFITCDDNSIEANIDAVAARLFAATETYVLTWAPSVTSLMKTVPTLAQAHRTLGPLLHR
jgi:hypothetical protein